MSKQRPTLFQPERLAYQVAGRAAVAYQYSIPTGIIALSCELNPRSVSRFASLTEYCGLRVSDSVDLNRVHYFVQFLMAAQVADMLHHEEAWFIRDLTKRKQFRRQWFGKVFKSPTHELDTAFFTIAAWLPMGPVTEVQKVFRQLWESTAFLIAAPSFWARLSRIAKQLQEGETFETDDLAEAMDIEPE